MKRNIFLVLVFTLILYSTALCQKAARGFVKDVISGEVLIGATVWSPLAKMGCVTNDFGFFSLSVNADSAHLLVSHLGYATAQFALINLDNNLELKLYPSSNSLNEVVVTSEQTKSGNFGQHTLSALDLKNTPVLLAEKDVLKTIQLLPGVQRNSEGTSNFSVRGGSHDQNLMLIDGVAVYNINHLWGFVSVFNTEAVNKVTFYKGGIPASYGGRLSSVIDIVLREGNPERYTGSVSLGLISSKFTFEGPIKKGKSSFLIAGRRSPYDLFSTPIMKLGFENYAGYYFQDYTLKLNWSPNDYNRFFVSSYAGNDDFYFGHKYHYKSDGFTDKFKFSNGWGNVTAALRWNNSSINNVFSNLSVSYTRFKYLSYEEFSIKYDNDNLKDETGYRGYSSGINDIVTRWQLSYYGIKNHQIIGGVEHTWHIFNPGVFSQTYKAQEPEGDMRLKSGSRNYGQELSLFVEDRFQYGVLDVNAGFRFTRFFVENSSYDSYQPRLAIALQVTNSTSLFGGYNQMAQYLHLVSNSNLGMPTDLWLPSSDFMPPQTSEQFSAGIKQRLFNSVYATVEAYYKEMNNVSDYRDGVIIREQTSDWHEALLLGKGTSKGVEFLLEKNGGNHSGWLTYTLSKSDRIFDEIRNGASFPFLYDRRHVVNILYNRKISNMKSINASWMVGSGQRITVYHDSFLANGQQINNYGERNNYSFPMYHHLDFSYVSGRKKKRGLRNWVLGVYNVYAKHNAFALVNGSRDGVMLDNSARKVRSVSLFPLIPYVSWEFIFN